MIPISSLSGATGACQSDKISRVNLIICANPMEGLTMSVQNKEQNHSGENVLFSEWIRRVGFWAFDFLSGSKVRRHFLDVKSIMENGTDPHISKQRDAYLNKILNYASENVEFYKSFKGYTSLTSFPVINKNIIRNNYQAFQSLEFPDSAVIQMRTSGSTGAPFVVRHDKNKRSRVYAEMMYFWGKADYQIGMKYVFFRISNPFSRLTAWMVRRPLRTPSDLGERRRPSNEVTCSCASTKGRRSS